MPDGVWTTEEFERAQFYRCYTLGHAWFDYDDTGPPPYTGTVLALRCERCGTSRRDVVADGTGELLWRRYEYPMGYKYGSERPTRDNFRVMLLRQRMDEQRKLRRKSS